MRTFSTSILALSLALGFASCSNDDNDSDNKKNTGASIAIDFTHPQYSNGALNVMVSSPAVIDASHVQVSITPQQEYRLEFVPEENEYFTFTSGGVLTGLVEGDDVGEISIRVLASDGTQLASKKIIVNVVGMLVTIVGHESYVNDTFRVVAGEEFYVTPANVKVEPGNPKYSVKFAPKETRYFSFSAAGILTAVLDGTGVIEAVVMSGADTVKVQPFYVEVSPRSSWVKSVSVDGNKTRHILSLELGKPISLVQSFVVEGGENKTLRYTSSNTAVATVNETTGEVTVQDVAGYAFITATATDGSERADSIRVTTARKFPGNSCDWNLCNILTDGNTKEDNRYRSCQVWDGNLLTAWVYRLNLTFTRSRYPGVTFLRGVYGKEWAPGDYHEANAKMPDWVLGGDPILKKETSWGVWAANMDAPQTFRKIVVTRGFYTDERGRKIYQSGTMYLEFWDNGSSSAPKLIKLGKKTFTSAPNDNEWVIDLTKSFEKWDTGTDASLGTAEYPDGVTGTELQMMFSTEDADMIANNGYYWAIADVLLFE